LFASIPVNRFAKRQKGNAKEHTGRGRVLLQGDVEGVDPWDFFPQPQKSNAFFFAAPEALFIFVCAKNLKLSCVL
jgi:hypothetical protein